MRPLLATNPGCPSDMAASTCWKVSATARVPDAVRIASSRPLTDGVCPSSSRSRFAAALARVEDSSSR